MAGIWSDEVASQRFFVAPARQGDSGCEAVSLATAVRTLAASRSIPPRVACEQLAVAVRSGSVAVLELRWDGEAVDACELVWREAAPRRVTQNEDDWISGEPVAPTITDARPAIVGRQGVADVLQLMANSDGVRSFVLAGRSAATYRMGLLLDEVMAVVSTGGAPDAANADSRFAIRPVGKPVDGLPEPADLAKEKRELEAQGVKGPIERLAEKYSVSRDTIERRLKKAGESASKWPAELVSIGGGKR